MDRAKATATGFDAAEAFYIGNMDSSFPGEKGFSHNQEWVTAEALTFVRGASPWFLYMNPTAPHSPGIKEALDLDLTATPQGTLASAPAAGATPTRADLWSRATTARNCPRTCDKKVALAAGALWVDDAVGVMLDELQTLGTLDQTMVIFSMDHGMSGKGALWEQGTRIATFVRYPPAFSAGSVHSGAVSNIDVRRAARAPARPRTRDGSARARDRNRNRSLCWSLILALRSSLRRSTHSRPTAAPPSPPSTSTGRAS